MIVFLADTRERVLRVVTGPAAGLLWLLLAADFALITLHLSRAIIGEPSGHTFDLGVDQGYGEFLNYLKIGWCALMLAHLAWQHRAGVFAVWSAAFTYYLADDWFSVHERAGLAMAQHAPALGEAAIHLGELAWLALIGVLVSGPLWWAWRRAPAEARAICRSLLVLVAVLAAFGVAVDAVHHLLFAAPVFDVPLTTFEDGGELVVMSVITAFLLGETFGSDRTTASGC